MTLAFALALCTLMPRAGAGEQPKPPVITAEQAYQLALEAETSAEWPEMLNWLEFAARRGYLPAQEHLAIALLSGDKLYGWPLSPNPCAAFRWFNHASEAGSEIGELYKRLLLRSRNRNGIRRCL